MLEATSWNGMPVLLEKMTPKWSFSCHLVQYCWVFWIRIVFPALWQILQLPKDFTLGFLLSRCLGNSRALPVIDGLFLLILPSNMASAHAFIFFFPVNSAKPNYLTTSHHLIRTTAALAHERSDFCWPSVTGTEASQQLHQSSVLMGPFFMFPL